jgi:hypothetical protein
MKTIILTNLSVRGSATRRILGLHRWLGRVQMPYLSMVFSTATPLILICAALMAFGSDMGLWEILLAAALLLVGVLLDILPNAFVCTTRPMALFAWPKLAAAPQPRMECLA